MTKVTITTETGVKVWNLKPTDKKILQSVKDAVYKELIRTNCQVKKYKGSL